MTHRQKRNMITWIIVGSIMGIFGILCIGYMLAIGQHGPIKNKLTNTYNVKYSSSEPVMELVRKSKEDEEDSRTINGFIYIDDQKVNIKCVVGGYVKRIFISYAGGYNPGDYEIGQDIFVAAYSIKGDTLTLKPYYDDDEYLVGEYKTIKLIMTSLDQN